MGDEERVVPFENVDRRTALEIIKGDLGDSINPPGTLKKSVEDANASSTPGADKGKQHQRPRDISEGGNKGAGTSAKGVTNKKIST